METFNVRLPWEPQIIMPINDIQYDGPGGGADLKRLAAHLAWGMERNALFIGLGDFIDFNSTGDRVKLQSAELHDTATSFIDYATSEILEKQIMDVLRPTVGRWIGIVQGHHYFHHPEDNKTTDQHFADWLGCPFLGDSALGRVSFRDEHSGVSAITVYVHHGAGGSGTNPAAAINKLKEQKVGYPGARLFMQGHVPQLAAALTAGLDITPKGPPHIIHEDTHYVVCGGWSRSFQQGSSFGGRKQGGFAEKKQYRPGVLGGPIIELTPERSSAGAAGKNKTSTIRSVSVKITV